MYHQTCSCVYTPRHQIIEPAFFISCCNEPSQGLPTRLGSTSPKLNHSHKRGHDFGQPLCPLCPPFLHHLWESIGRNMADSLVGPNLGHPPPQSLEREFESDTASRNDNHGGMNELASICANANDRYPRVAITDFFTDFFESVLIRANGLTSTDDRHTNRFLTPKSDDVSRHHSHPLSNTPTHS